jgi:hypothetical protein
VIDGNRGYGEVGNTSTANDEDDTKLRHRCLIIGKYKIESKLKSEFNFGFEIVSVG